MVDRPGSVRIEKVLTVDFPAPVGQAGFQIYVQRAVPARLGPLKARPFPAYQFSIPIEHRPRLDKPDYFSYAFTSARGQGFYF